MAPGERHSPSSLHPLFWCSLTVSERMMTPLVRLLDGSARYDPHKNWMYVTLK